MKKIALIEVMLDDDVPEYMDGILRIGSVISKNENDDEIKDHQELVNNNEFHSKDEIIRYIAKKLKVEETIVQIIE
ncbi:hypothetical protein [Ereboglobus luteus]|uniref:Uncharacterized protein n=1 Tax=Ereboglobus luteus TaxID=1796921 RepID=A0A2U8E1E7_9BACT|nr:hypothetical protein [Ereboglobus luteus]AWI08677.1 hypothetical protein CKA38_04875 [Ereboglobus luteus]